MRWPERYLPTPIREVERLGVRVVDGVRVTEALHPADEERRPHAHAGPTIAILLAGCFHESVIRSTWSCRERGGLIRCAGLVHANRYGSTGARVLHLELPAFEDSPLTGEGAAPEWRRLDSPRLSLLGWALRAEIWHADPASSLACESLITELVAEVTCEDRVGESSRRSVPPWLNRARELLWDRAFDAVTIAEIAHELGIHRVTLARGFRQHLDTTPGAYLRRARLARAMPEIGFGDRSLSAVAVAAGFYDQSHLNRWVSREMGTTPGRLRAGRPRRDSMSDSCGGCRT